MEAVDTQSDRVRLAFKLFDSEGVSLVNTLALGEEGLRNAAAEAEAFGRSVKDWPAFEDAPASLAYLRRHLQPRLFFDRIGADNAAIIYSSGSTGRPKGAVLSHAAVAGVDVQIDPDPTGELSSTILERYEDRLARIAAEVNQSVENIGARRLQTVMERLLDEISFTAPDRKDETVTITKDYVTAQLSDLVGNTDLSKFIL